MEAEGFDFRKFAFVPGSCIGHYDESFSECSDKCRRSKACRRLTRKVSVDLSETRLTGKRKIAFETALEERMSFKTDWAAVSKIVEEHGGMNKKKGTGRK